MSVCNGGYDECFLIPKGMKNAVSIRIASDAKNLIRKENVTSKEHKTKKYV